MIFTYKGREWPEYLRTGNACQHIAASALHFCKGRGLDVGAGAWPLHGATPVDVKNGGDAMDLPHGPTGYYDFIFSSHCLEHLENPIAALEHWRSRIYPENTPGRGTARGGVLFLYLPHPDMIYWRPQHCRKHLHSWTPAQMAEIVRDLGFDSVIHSERDLAWSFSVVGFKGA
jgi:SAM-dependent methyltransferase